MTQITQPDNPTITTTPATLPCAPESESVTLTKIIGQVVAAKRAAVSALNLLDSLEYETPERKVGLARLAAASLSARLELLIAELRELRDNLKLSTL